jgi:hypothetical protein
MKSQATGFISILIVQFGKLWKRDRAGSLKTALRTLGNPMIINRVLDIWCRF